MTDLRQGVTPTQHAVLDRVEQQHAIQMAEGYESDFQECLEVARNFAAVAAKSRSLAGKREAAIMAAAMLIDAADEIGRLIYREPDPIE